MNNTKSPKNVSLKNQLELWLFCALIGAVAGALVWILLKIMAVGTEFLWKWFPGKTSVPYYTILICVAGAAIIGIFRKIFGDYPEDLETVMEKVRTEKRYEYKNMLKFRLCTRRTDHNGAVVFQQKLQYIGFRKAIKYNPYHIDGSETHST